MKVITSEATAEVVEKKSRFIANMFYISSEDEAESKLNEIRKKHYDAKHNCYAYVIGKDAETLKSSDDGEPSGTAGHPMLDILKGNNLTNCIAIVTRYFGGTLLGTGGLVRCYSDSLKNAIQNATLSDILIAYEVSFDIDYEEYGKVENSISVLNSDDNVVYVLDKIFEDVVKLKCLVLKDYFAKFKTDLTNITKGRVALADNNLTSFYLRNKEIVHI